MTSSILRIVCAVVAACCVATPSWAQQAGRVDRPYRGLFGGGGAGEFDQSLVANASLGVGLDNNILAVSGIASDAQELLSPTANGRSRIQQYGYLAGGLSYSLSKSRVSVGASLGTVGQYVPNIASPYVPSYSGSVGVSLKLSRRSQLTANQNFALQPYNVLVLGLPLSEPALGQAAVIEPTFGVRREDRVGQVSDVGFTRQIGRRASVGLAYSRMRSSTASGEDDLSSQMASARFSTALTKGLGAHLGYAYTEGRLPGETLKVVEHNIDAGLDYARTLGLTVSRRTKLSFSTGSSIVSYRRHTLFRLTGTATLTHEIARSWAASLSYDRGMGFIERFREPFFSDSVTLGVNGLIARRLNFRSAAGAVRGNLGVAGEAAQQSANAFRSYFGTTGLTMGLTRSLGLGTDYTYYQYGFSQLQGLPTGVARQMGRHSARIYLSVWVPILQRGRRTNAPR